jgi:hypothetical protein
MKKNSLSPIDILGITLGTIVILVVIVGAIVVARVGRFRAPWSWDSRGWVEELSPGSEQREEKDQTIQGSFREIDVSNIAGEIRVSGGGSGGVQVHSVKTAPSARALQAVQVQIDTQGDRLVIREKREDLPMFRSGSISYSVTIPKGVKSVIAHSVSGSITVDVEAGIDQRLETISGSIRTSRAANMRASSTSGMIDFAFAGSTLDVHSISGAIKGQIDSIDKNGSVNAGTVSGSIDLSAFPGLEATLNLRSLSGHVSCDFPMTISVQKNNTLEGRIGGGAVSINANTVSGSIDIRKK